MKKSQGNWRVCCWAHYHLQKRFAKKGSIGEILLPALIAPRHPYFETLAAKIEVARAKKLEWDRWLLAHKARALGVPIGDLDTIIQDLAKNRPAECIKLHKEWHNQLSKI